MSRWWLIAPALAVGLGGGPAPAAASQGIGVLIMAHGGSAQWNQLVRDTVDQAQLQYPTQIAFGMGMHGEEVEQLQAAVTRLEQAQVERIIAVPLLVSADSEVMRQLQYLLGLREHGPWEGEELAPVALKIPVVMTKPLEDDPVVADILLERAQELSRSPDEEAVMVVAHGPVSDEDNARWLQFMQRLCQQIQLRGRFRAAVPLTMRDDAPAPIRDAATEQMRRTIQEHGQSGRVLVVPLLIASGGVETKIPQRLEGLQYAYRGAALLPHHKIAQWIAQQVNTATATAARPEAPKLVARGGTL